MQLDIFYHSRDVMLRNDVLASIAARQVQSGRMALSKLESAYPQDNLLPTLTILVDTLEVLPCHFADPTAALAARERLETVIQPAVAQLLSPTQARLWIAHEWRILAEAAYGLAYDPVAPQAHAAPLLLRAGEWTAAETVVNAINSWRRIPLPLAWMAEARLGWEGIEASWPLLVELAWLDPACFEALVRRLEEPTLRRLLRDFDANFENDTDSGTDADDLAWFPAWCLIVVPGLAPLIRQAEPGMGRNPERAARLLLDILSLEKQGSHNHLLELRKKLRRLHASLFARYMQTR